MNLNEIWINCIAMWTWIVEQIKNGSKLSIDKLKEIWLKEHGFKDIIDDCFFCGYDFDNDNGDCFKCPGVLVDPEFSCLDTNYHYRHHPADFLKRITELNKIRLETGVENENRN